MKTDACIEMYTLAYNNICQLAEHLRNGQTLSLNEEYLNALTKFDQLNTLLSGFIREEIAFNMARTQKHIKMFKKPFSVATLNED